MERNAVQRARKSSLRWAIKCFRMSEMRSRIRVRTPITPDPMQMQRRMKIPDQTLPVLYSFRRCPYAMRARLALSVSGQSCELREVVLRDKPAEMIAASPKATVPVLIDVDGAILEESLHIMLWALDRNDPENWLTPESGDRDQMLDLIERIDGLFKHHLDRYKYANRYDGGADRSIDHRAEALGHLQELEHRLTQHDYLFGERLSLADIAIAPFVRQFANTDAEWFAAQPVPRLQAWLTRFTGSDLFLSCMTKHIAWENTGPGIIFPAA